MILLWLCILWVFAATAVAFLPMRRQYLPGVLLLLAAPVLIALIFFQVGFFAGFAALAGFLSMFRNPLRYLWARLRGRNPQVPE